MPMRHLALAAAAAACCVPATAARAQIRASERAAVSQTVDGTTFTVDYARPRVRGRDPLFGSRAVHWGETWTPGANWATTLELSRAATVGGRKVAKGKYSVWMVPRASGNWTLVLDPKPDIFHMSPPDSSAAQVRLAVRAEPAPFTEVLTFEFPEVTTGGTTLAFRWARTRVAVPLQVEPSLAVELPEAEAAPYVGRWTYVKRDTPDEKPVTIEFRTLYEGGTLKAEWLPADPYMQRFALVRVRPDLFFPGLYDKDGKIYEVMRPDMAFTFTRVGGRPDSLEVRYSDDFLAGTARRKP
ncbi:DUF2911 domain-containing protein [Roseisolibacter sp. H3M3-2]|uniref:DUF2911 domain-containing protein n=1 Tax=Roseisolibacter sp. H3M3-2 TaxID=3031323 RepID=UPI0023DC4AD7|nr:DUF2911 domain-containing protein [Roseisolibacter sp. H3M3-2]MDF1501693.1 DUF2911 domain-containing protein [Roseisolibacter sp. H3M3-2]